MSRGRLVGRLVSRAVFFYLLAAAAVDIGWYSLLRLSWARAAEGIGRAVEAGEARPETVRREFLRHAAAHAFGPPDPSVARVEVRSVAGAPWAREVVVWAEVRAPSGVPWNGRGRYHLEVRCRVLLPRVGALP